MIAPRPSFITGESYWILIGESQEVILNGKTRNLTCVAVATAGTR